MLKLKVPLYNFNCSISSFFSEEDIDDLNIHVVRYRPEELSKLTKITKFNKKEIQLIYRGFKQVRIFFFKQVLELIFYFYYLSHLILSLEKCTKIVKTINFGNNQLALESFIT